MTSELANRAARGTLSPGESMSVGGELKELRVTSRSGMFDPEVSQAYFWTEEWQAGEREADEDIAAGRGRHFDSAAEAIEYLRELRT